MKRLLFTDSLFLIQIQIINRLQIIIFYILIQRNPDNRPHGRRINPDRESIDRPVDRWLGDEERRLMHLVPAPAVKLMKGRVLSRPGMKKCLGLSNLWFHSVFNKIISPDRP